ncbi:universal stress protein [Lysobacter koreensis]|uniref:Universal stress protein n=1 Tax=Lysobacter koreensis TaxID=266122 RepID=A0ABW2YHT1_9GAMM
MVKDLMIPITNTAGDANALAAAIALAARTDAHLCVLEAFNLPMPAPSPWGLLPDLAMSDLYTTLRAKAEGDAAVWRERLAKESVPSEVRVAEALFVEPPRMAALHARYSDMAVMTAATSGYASDEPVIHGFFSALLLESGRPVLVVPPRFTSHQPAKHAVVAWRPTREATRALHDAMPLLHAAESVDVLEVGPQGGERGDGPQPGADIATHLARHGLKVRVVVSEPSGESVAMALMKHAEQSGAELLVAGGYGHSRFREWVLGGVTRELLKFSSVPILFSH